MLKQKLKLELIQCPQYLEKKEWTLIFSTDLNVWGSYFYDEANDVARVTAKTTISDESLEAFSIMFDEKGNMVSNLMVILCGDKDASPVLIQEL